MAAVVSGLDAADVGDDLADCLRSALPLYRYVQTPPARAMSLHGFLVESHLELDLSFVSVDELRSTGDLAPQLRDRDLDPTNSLRRGERS
jgi:hypothetical protein